MSYELTLSPTVEAVGRGRRWVTDALCAWGLESLVYTAALLTSEVLTNALLHARTDMVLNVKRSGLDGATISVRDGSTHPPRRRSHSSEATTGRGLTLLDQLAQNWSVESRPDGKTLTFTVGGDIDPWAAFADSDWSDAEA
jgi:anti-sigma regulatory factor (Ser/Thr protein kinase)